MWTQVIGGVILIAALMIWQYACWNNWLIDAPMADWLKISISAGWFLGIIAICSFVLVPYLGPILSGENKKEPVEPIEDGTTFLRVGASATGGHPSIKEVLTSYTVVIGTMGFLLYNFAKVCVYGKPAKKPVA